MEEVDGMVPLLITMDLEIAKDHNINGQGMILEKINNDFKSINTKFTTFTTSEAAEFFPEQIKLIRSSGNEIGCHGLNHGSEENYKTLTEAKIISYIASSTKNIGRIISDELICFRGPGMSTSSITQTELIKNGYKADFSICSQRFDFLRTKGGDIWWLLAPRIPYKPSDKNPYRKGNLPIYVIPLSCAGLPFISGILYIFGLYFMKLFFKILLKESIRTNKPIVYLFHSYEFTEYKGNKEIYNDVTGIKRNKRSHIQKMYLSNHNERYRLNIEFIKYMLSFKTIKAYTGKEYTEILTEG